MKYITMCFVIVSLLSQSSLQASPLRFVPQTVKQPTGEIVRCYASGDEYFSWLHDKDGFTIVQDEEGFYVYAARTNGLLVPTDNVVGKSDPQTLGMQKWLKPEKQYIMEKVETLISNKSQLGKNSGRSSTVSAPTKGTLNNLVVFIRFSDESEFTESPAVFDAMFNNTQSTANSLYNYYNEASYGQLQIRSKFYPVSSNNSIKSYFDSNPRNFYNVYSVTNPIGYKTGIEKSGREHTLLANAIGFIQKDITPADNFDGDEDGNIDNVCFIVKGAPEVWASTLWPHMWSLDSRNVLVNGKKVTTYNFQLERNLLDLGVGVLSHEMFHSLGAPDLYHYSLDEMNPVASWDLMENTTNPPQHMGAYMKFRYGHWITSIPEISNAGTYYLQPLISSKQNSFKIASPNSNSEYYVLEYRKQKGVFDKSVPSEGLLVYRINQTSDGQGNAVVASDEAYIYRPGGSNSSNGEPDKASLSFNSGRTAINDYSNPSSVLSNNLPGGLDLYEVGSLSDSISFKVRIPKAYTLALTSPIGGENFKINGQTNITWINTSVSDIKIELSLDSVKWQEITTVKGQSGVNQGQFLWKIPSQPTTTGKIRISDLNDVSSFSLSRNYFAISTNGQLFEVEPNNSRLEATPIARGDTFEGNIDPEGEADYYRFTASAGDTIDVFAGAVNSTLWGRIMVLNDAGILDFDDGLYNGLITNQRLSVLIPASGAYYIRYAFKDSFGPASGRLIDSRPDSYQTYSSNLNNLSATNTGKYRISLQKFRSSPPDFSGFGGAWNVTLNSAALQWYVQENGCVSKYTFEYGPTNYYGNEIDASSNRLPLYRENYVIAPKISSLLPNTTYHFRIRAENKFGTFYSKDQVFSTAKESDNWERQLVDGEVPFAQYFPFSETSGVAIAMEFMFKTSDGGLSWGEKIRYPSNFIASGASFISINNGWIVGDGIYKTTDGGASWSKQNKPTSKYLKSVCFVDGNNGWAVGMQGVIIHTSDGGTNWIVQDPGYNGEPWEGLYAVAFCDLKNGIASGTTGTLLKTTDSGLTWSKLQTGTTASLNGVYFHSPLNATTLGDGPCGGPGNILHTTDGGKTWVNQNNPTGEYLYAVDYWDDNNALGVGIDGAIAKTTDGGKTWVEQESGVRSVLRDVKFLNSSKAVIVGDWSVILRTKDLTSKAIALKSPRGNEVWGIGSVQEIRWQKNNLSKINITFSTDGGNKWNTIAQNISASLNTYNWLIPNAQSSSCVVKVSDATDNTVVAQNTGLFSIRNVTTGVAADVLPTEFSLSQNYPNPFNPSTRIRFGLPVSASTTLVLYDLLGREIQTLLNDELSAGYHEVEFNAGNLASGIYVYRLSTDKFSAVKMMILVK